EVVGVGGLPRRQLPEAQAEPLGAHLAAEQRALRVKALGGFPILVEVRRGDRRHRSSFGSWSRVLMRSLATPGRLRRATSQSRAHVVREERKRLCRPPSSSKQR